MADDYTGMDLSGISGFDLNSLLNDTSWMNSFTTTPTYDYTGGYGSYDLNNILGSLNQSPASTYDSSLANQNWVNQFDPAALGYMKDDAGNWVSPNTSSTGGSFLSGLGGTVGSLGSSLLNFLNSSTGKAALGLGGAAATIGGGTPTTNTNLNYTPQMSPAGQGVFGLASAQPTTLPQNTTNLLSQMNLGSLLNTFPAQTWQNAENMIPQTQAAREAALQSTLGRVSPYWATKGNDIQDMIRKVSEENYNMTNLATQLQTQKAAAQQAANIQAPTQYSNVLGLSNYPQTYTNQQIKNLADILQATERGTMGSSSTGANTSLLTQLGGVLAGLSSAK